MYQHFLSSNGLDGLSIFFSPYSSSVQLVKFTNPENYWMLQHGCIYKVYDEAKACQEEKYLDMLESLFSS